VRTFIISFCFLAAPLCAQTPAPVVTPAQWMRALADDFLVPGYEELKARAGELDAATQDLCAAPGAERLAAAQARWRSTALAWRRVTALPIGPTLARRSLRRFDFRPTRPAAIEAAIAHAEAGGAAERIGVAARGLPALEHLLFSDARLSSQPARCRYAAWLAKDFRGEAAALAGEWRKWGAQWRDAYGDGDEAHAAMTDAVNALVGTLERLQRELQKPGLTRPQLIASLEGVEQVLAGANRVLRGLGHLGLAERLERLAREARASLQDPASAHRALGRLQAAVSTDLADALRVTVGFNEADGD
jgi:predicted lipoprotein